MSPDDTAPPTQLQSHPSPLDAVRLYRRWRNMIQRVRPNAREFCRRIYHLRGITVCDRWRKSFENFLDDMGFPPTWGHSLDRINNDGNYEPGNCRWATQDVQLANRRKLMFTHDGRTQNLKQWAEELRITRNRLYSLLGRRAGIAEVIDFLCNGAGPHSRAALPQCQENKLTLNGETLPISAWAARLGIGKDAIRKRLCAGWPVAEALAVPRCINSRKRGRSNGEEKKLAP